MGKCVLLDPGQQDELHGLHEDSTPDHKMTFHLTHWQVVIQQCMARFRKILQMAKKQYTGGDVQEVERELAKVSCTTLDPHEFEDYIVAWSKVWGLLSTFYSSAQTVHVRLHHQFHAKHAPLQAFIGPLSKTATCKTHQYLAHKPTNYPLHRKLRLSAYINKKHTDEWLVGELCQWFGQDVVLVIGNWSALMARFHEPQRGKGLRQMLVKQGFKVYLVDEFRTSKTCPTCEMATLTTFKDVLNPRPWRCAMQPIVRCHGLLWCATELCKVSVMVGDRPELRPRVWNRDTAAALNFVHILHSLRSTGTVPDRFLRPAARKRAVADRAQAAAAYTNLVAAIGGVAAAAGGPDAATGAPAVMANAMDAACGVLAAAAGAMAARAGDIDTVCRVLAAVTDTLSARPGDMDAACSALAAAAGAQLVAKHQC
ncbi:hypothetical protein H4R19_004679 [Coemansia spiralis]|nr:hypothetical protein H4R19_004679 [Coemansia spiralis]